MIDPYSKNGETREPTNPSPEMVAKDFQGIMGNIFLKLATLWYSFRADPLPGMQSWPIQV